LLHSAGEEWRKAVALGHLPAAMAAAAANRFRRVSRLPDSRLPRRMKQYLDAPPALMALAQQVWPSDRSIGINQSIYLSIYFSIYQSI